MCGRINVSDLEGLDELIASIAARPDPTPQTAPRWNVAPTRPLSVVHAHRDQLHTATMRWGIGASWATSGQAAPKPLFNARSESVFEKPSFQDHAQHRRVVIPVNGYYEWSVDGTARLAHHIFPTNARAMLIAGIWNGDSQTPACCVLTRDAIASLTEVHDRMPVLLTPSQAGQWIVDDENCRAIMQSEPEVSVSVQAVSDHVNNARNDGPECLQPWRAASEPSQGSLFDS